MRRAVLMGAAVLVGLIVLPVSLPAAVSSAQTFPVGTGITHCNGGWTGTVTFTPALMNGGTSSNEELSITAIVQPCTGGVPTPTKGKLISKGVIMGTNANDCNNFFALPAPPGGTDTQTFAGNFGGQITWSPTSIAQSSLQWPTMNFVTTSTANPVVFKAPTITVTHSYPTAVGKFKFKTTQLLSAIVTSCGTASGLTSVTIASAGSIGKF